MTATHEAAPRQAGKLGATRGARRVAKAPRALQSDGDPLSAEGQPLRSYRGWDDAAGIFIQDDPRTLPRFGRRPPATTRS